MGDRRKCQTYAASPAEPGGLPVMLGVAGTTRFQLILLWQRHWDLSARESRNSPGSPLHFEQLTNDHVTKKSHRPRRDAHPDSKRSGHGVDALV
jgi:hypothetical protein